MSNNIVICTPSVFVLPNVKNDKIFSNSLGNVNFKCFTNYIYQYTKIAVAVVQKVQENLLTCQKSLVSVCFLRFYSLMVFVKNDKIFSNSIVNVNCNCFSTDLYQYTESPSLWFKSTYQRTKLVCKKIMINVY